MSSPAPNYPSSSAGFQYSNTENTNNSNVAGDNIEIDGGENSQNTLNTAQANTSVTAKTNVPALKRSVLGSVTNNFSSPMPYPTSAAQTPTSTATHSNTNGLTSAANAYQQRDGGRRQRNDIEQLSGRQLQSALRSTQNDPQSSQPAPTSAGPTMYNPPSSSQDSNGGINGQARALIWATTVDPTESMAIFKDFLMNFALADRKKYDYNKTITPGGISFEQAVDDGLVTLSDVEKERGYYRRVLMQRTNDAVQIVNLDAQNLLAYSKGTQMLYGQLVKYPQEIVLHVLDFVVTTLYCELAASGAFGADCIDEENVSFKVRPYNLSKSVNLRDLNPTDVDKLVSIKGFVIRASNPIPELRVALFKCGECGHTMNVGVENGRVKEPEKCLSSVTSANARGTGGCQGKDIQLIHSLSSFYDRQIVRVQETPDAVPDGQTPHTVSIVCYDELVDGCRPGDRVEITGIYRAMPVRLNAKQRATRSLFKTFVDALFIKRSDQKRMNVKETTANADVEQLHEEDAISAETMEKIVELSQMPDLYTRLASSLAPSIYSRLDAKKAVLLQLFGGSNKALKESDTKYRGNIHVLLCGDPATSKSQLLQYVHRLAPRGIYTSGKGSSAVGLTAYVTRDPDTRQLVLESGALVLSDGGICCIDEFDKMSESTRSVLHEAMEQQTVSVAKAGIVTTLNARSSILAAANPIFSRWHDRLSVAQNLNLPPTLLSRFDVIYLMLDRADEVEDTLLARHISCLYLSNENRIPIKHIVDLELFAAYISYARSNIEPRMNDECLEMIANAYVEFRQMGTMSATTRQLEGIIRLSEAHAKMRLSHSVERQDVDEAVRLIKAALQTSATDPITGQIDFDYLTFGVGKRERNAKENMCNGISAVFRRVIASNAEVASGLAPPGTAVVRNISKADLQAKIKEENGSVFSAGQAQVPGQMDKFEECLREVVGEVPGVVLRGGFIYFE